MKKITASSSQRANQKRILMGLFVFVIFGVGMKVAD
jgi:hypothetical protein